VAGPAGDRSGAGPPASTEGMSMRHLARRLARVEAHVDRHEDRLPWADVHDALARQQARVRIKLCQYLGVAASDRRVAEAISLLAGDDEARIAQDAEVMARWRRQQGITVDLAESRQRVTTRLNALADRLQAARSHPIPVPRG
jgi:hypothetical protein